MVTSWPSLFLLVYLVLAALCLGCCAQAHSSGEPRPLLVTAHGLLMAVASLVAELALRRAGTVAGAHELSCLMVCGITLDQESNPCP